MAKTGIEVCSNKQKMQRDTTFDMDKSNKRDNERHLLWRGGSGEKSRLQSKLRCSRSCKIPSSVVLAIIIIKEI